MLTLIDRLNNMWEISDEDATMSSLAVQSVLFVKQEQYNQEFRSAASAGSTDTAINGKVISAIAHSWSAPKQIRVRVTRHPVTEKCWDKCRRRAAK